MNELQVLRDTVVKGGYCIGCGACSAISNGATIEMDSLGQLQASINVNEGREVGVLSVCPFSSASESETQIANEVFSPDDRKDPYIGSYKNCFAGHVVDGAIRSRGSSGGVAKWLLAELLVTDEVDYVIQVGQSSGANSLYKYKVYTNAEEVREGSKSVYYPVEMSEVLEFIADNPGRYAITAIPCFAKALRLLMKASPMYQERVVYIVGIICGHLKSSRYAEMLAWQQDIDPPHLQSIDFRLKSLGDKASDKGVEVRSERGESRSSLTKQLFGGNYNLGFFQYKACDYCDDVVGETADVSVGDAWLEEYVCDPKGNSVLVVRNKRILQLIKAGIESEELSLDEITADKVQLSQAGGFRQRREGLKYRLYLTDLAGKWRPEKRVTPEAKHISRRRRAVYRYRQQLSNDSHSYYSMARSSGDFSLFKKPMELLVNKYQGLNRPPFFIRVLQFLRRLIRV